MAYKLVTNNPALPFIWNVSSHVGHLDTCQNRRTDVELLQFMLSEMFHQFPHTNGAAMEPQVRPNGKYDAALGFWIFRAQDQNQNRDGIVSPAKGTHFAAGHGWVIAKINYHFKNTFPDRWANLDSDPRLSPALRAELKRTNP